MSNKTVQMALTTRYGIGHKKASLICAQCGISDEFEVRELTRYQLELINQYIGVHYITESELKKAIHNDIKRSIAIASYRGFRHHAKLPVRGQRTHTNAKTRRRTHSS